MSKRKAPTDTWGWIEKSLRTLAGPGWRKAGRELFEFRAGEMRAVLDFDLAERERRGAENIIGAALRKRAEDLRQEAEAAERDADAFEDACIDRRAKVEADKFAHEQDSVAEMMAAYCVRNGVTMLRDGREVDFYGNPVQETA